MLKHIDIYKLTTNEQFRNRVQTSVFLTSRDILNEEIPEGAMFAPRYNLARRATSLDALALNRFVWECAANPAIAAAEITSLGSARDGDINYVVSTTWNSIAAA